MIRVRPSNIVEGRIDKDCRVSPRPSWDEQSKDKNDNAPDGVVKGVAPAIQQWIRAR